MLAVAVFLSASSVHAQFDDFNGEDGPFDLSSEPPGTVVDFDLTDLNDDGIFQFTLVNIPTDVTVRFRPDKAGASPIIWFVQGAVQIDGSLDLNGDAGSSDPVGLFAAPGSGGFGGGLGAHPPSQALQGFGPGAGTNPGHGAGHGTAGVTDNCTLDLTTIYGNPFLVPFLGGSGGSGGGFITTVGGGGGAGGGAILIASAMPIVINGMINARGGDAGVVGPNEGGGGSGGSIRLVSPSISGTGELRTDGGDGLTPGICGDGGIGRIRLETLDLSGLSTVVGNTRVVTLAPNTPLDPSDFPSLRVVQVGVVPVPENPNSGFNPADVVIDEQATLTIYVEASGIPLSVVVDATIWNESLGIIALDTLFTALTGTVEASTASATATFPAGFSLIFINATWNLP